MSAHDNGGPAFPRPSYGPNEPADGMTLRDYFAAKAMQATIAGGAMVIRGVVEAGHARHGRALHPDTALALSAYDMADAMLDARNKS